MNYIGLKMKKIIKLIVSILGFVFLLTNASLAKKQHVPIIMDDHISFVHYHTTTNNLQIPIPSDANGYKDIVVQCEDDITYFIMASNIYFNKVSLTTSSGNIVIEEEGISEGYITYKKGYIEGNESVSITGKVYHDNQLFGETTERCSRSTFTSENRLQVPTFNGNSQGKLVTQCEDDVVYYIMAYDCLRQDTNPYVKASVGTVIIDEKKHVGEVFYTKGHVKRTGGPVTITGEVFSGGKILYTWPYWIQTCP